MKNLVLISSFLLFISLLIWIPREMHPEFPAPTSDTQIKFGEEGEQQDKREQWLELMHRADDNTNWRSIEYQNQMRKHQQRSHNILFRSDCDQEVIAEGQVKGQWLERGSVNQAGSVFDVEYDAEADEIWLISAGGTLWKADRFGIEWEVINQDLKFRHGLLKFVSTDNGRRLLAFTGNLPHYSDDEGQTWQVAEGIQNSGDVRFSKPVVLDDSLNTFYFLSKPDYWSNISLYKSTDKGESFEIVEGFDTHEFNRYTLCKPHHSNDLFLLEKEEDGNAEIFWVDPISDELISLSDEIDLNLGEARANLIASSVEGETRFYTYARTYNDTWENYEQQVYYSTNLGEAWEEKGKLPTNPWSVGMYVMPSNPDILIYGEVNCYKSIDGGDSWDLVNEWWEYYGNECCRLHADIMDITEFETEDGEYFQLISHHGGLTYSTNYLTDQNNISLYGLNVSQYYSVRTDPLNPDFVYAGSQDQGFQRSSDFGTPEIAAFDQVISGDYGHIVFSNNGQSLWTVYPGGWVSYYPNPQSEGLQASFDLNSENESVWIPPLIASTIEGEDVIYMAGGSSTEGPGSFIIRLEANDNTISVNDLPFNFKEESGGGEVSAIEISKLNPDRWYAATTNGRVFASEDAGENWEQALNFIPSGHYLYGQTLLASSQEEQVAYLGGSGYSNPPIYKTVNGGTTFFAIDQGMPSTLVFDLATNSDESLLFAATEAGPYVYVAEAGRWYDLSGQCAPNQTYWSVEFVESSNVARFGTYGRGIWDFELDDATSTFKPIINDQMIAFPNPATDWIELNLEGIERTGKSIEVFNVNGQRVYQSAINADRERINLGHLTKGAYFLQIRSEDTLFTQKIVLN